MRARNRFISIEADSIMNEHDRKKKALQTKTPQVGPRSKFFHYINDLNLDFEKAVDEILREFPSLNKEIIEIWEKESIKKERTEANNER